MKKARKLPLFGNIRVLCVSALLCGISIVLAWVCKTYLTLVFLGNGVRITFENLPIILSGLWFGPWVGASVGFAADFISTALSQYGLGGINPLIVRHDGRYDQPLRVPQGVGRAVGACRVRFPRGRVGTVQNAGLVPVPFLRSGDMGRCDLFLSVASLAHVFVHCRR